MTPADLPQDSLGVGDEDRLVADVAKIPSPVPIEQLKDLIGPRRAGEPGRGLHPLPTHPNCPSPGRTLAGLLGASGSRDSSTGFILQPLSCTLRACDALK